MSSVYKTALVPLVQYVVENIFRINGKFSLGDLGQIELTKAVLVLPDTPS